MRNGSKVVDGLYIKRVLLALEDFLFFSLYSFSSLAKQVTSLKQLRLLSCLDFLETNFERLACFPISHLCYQYHLRPTPPVTFNNSGVIRQVKHRQSNVGPPRKSLRADKPNSLNGEGCVLIY